MRTNSLQVIHSIISARWLVEKLLSKYALGQTQRCVLLARGVNDSYLVDSDKGSFVVRIYRMGLRTGGEIEAELTLLEELKRKHLPVSVPIRDKADALFHALDSPEGKRHAAVFSYARGKPLDRRSPDQLRLLGRFTANLHSIPSVPGDLNRPTIDTAYLLHNPIRQLQPFFSPNSVSLMYLTEVAEGLSEKVQSLPQSAPLFGLCHGDLQMRNVHFDASGEITVFDFDHCGYGWHGYEFGSILRDIGGINAVWDDFVEAYTSVRTLSAREMALLPHFAAIRCIWELGLVAELIDEVGYNRLTALVEYEILKLKEWVGRVCDM
jgi:Ser/Thr protein kinase RdoA (MazF antagonist)